MSLTKFTYIFGLLVLSACGSGLETNNVQTLSEALQSTETPTHQNSEAQVVPAEEPTVNVGAMSPSEVTPDSDRGGEVIYDNFYDSVDSDIIDTLAEDANSPLMVEESVPVETVAEVIPTDQVEIAQNSRFYLDSDLDGFGDANQFVDVPTQPEGYVAVTGDCDDTTSRIHSAAIELPGNLYDENCDGIQLLYFNQSITPYELLLGVKIAHSKWPHRSLTYHNPINKTIISETYPVALLSPSGLVNNCGTVYYNEFLDNTLVSNGNDCVDIFNGLYKTSEAITYIYDENHPTEMTSSQHVKITDVNADGIFDPLTDSVVTTNFQFDLKFDELTDHKLSRTETMTVDGVVTQTSYNTYDPQSDSDKLLKEAVDVGANGSLDQIVTYTRDEITLKPLTKTQIKGRDLETPSAQIQSTEVTTFTYDEYWGTKTETIVTTDAKGVVTTAVREFVNSYIEEPVSND